MEYLSKINEINYIQHQHYLLVLLFWLNYLPNFLDILLVNYFIKLSNHLHNYFLYILTTKGHIPLIFRNKKLLYFPLFHHKFSSTKGPFSSISNIHLSVCLMNKRPCLNEIKFLPSSIQFLIFIWFLLNICLYSYEVRWFKVCLHL